VSPLPGGRERKREREKEGQSERVQSTPRDRGRESRLQGGLRQLQDRPAAHTVVAGEGGRQRQVKWTTSANDSLTGGKGGGHSEGYGGLTAPDIRGSVTISRYELESRIQCRSPLVFLKGEGKQRALITQHDRLVFEAHRLVCHSA